MRFFLPLAVCFIAVICFTPAHAWTVERFMHAPKTLPSIQFVNANGATENIGQYKGKVVLLNYWATWCKPCVHEMPALARINKALAPKGVVVLPVALEKPSRLESIKLFMQRYKLEGLPILFDVMKQGSNQLKVQALPTSYVIDKKGRNVATIQGMVNWDHPDYTEYLLHLAGE